MNWHTAVMLRLKMLKSQICHWAHYKRCLMDCCRASECQSYFIQSVVPMQKLYVSTTRDWREGHKTVGRIRRHHPRERLLIGSWFSVTELWNYCSELRNNTTLIHVIPLPLINSAGGGEGGLHTQTHTHTQMCFSTLSTYYTSTHTHRHARAHTHTHSHTKPPTQNHPLSHTHWNSV